MRRAAPPARRTARARASEDGAGRGTGEQKRAGDEEGDSDDQRAGLPDHVREAAAERAADRASLVAAERDHQPERADDEPGAKRLQVDDLAAHEHQAADRDQHERDRRTRRPRRRRGARRPRSRRRRRRPTRARAASPGRGRPRPSRAPRARDDGAIGSSCAPLPDAGRCARLGRPPDGLLPGHGHGACSFCGRVPSPPHPPGRFPSAQRSRLSARKRGYGWWRARRSPPRARPGPTARKAGTISLVTSPASEVSSSITCHQRFAALGRSTSVSTTGHSPPDGEQPVAVRRRGRRSSPRRREPRSRPTRLRDAAGG